MNAKSLAIALDEGKKGYVTKKNFLNFFEALETVSFIKKVKVSTKNTTVYKIKVYFRKIVDHPGYEGTVTFLCVLNLLALFIEDYLFTYGRSLTQARTFIVS